MARIRSIHPEQWTDEDFVELSMEARLLCLAIRNECDDKGVFEWKPKKLKMRLFPADNVDVEELLVELVSNRFVEKFEFDTRPYGVVRNFRKYQRPKNPNDIYPLPDHLRRYAGLDGEVEHVQHVELSPSGEIQKQMEDGGGKGNSLSNDKHVDFDTFWNSWPSKVSKATALKAWRNLTNSEKRLAASMAADWFADWRSKNPRASNIGASRYLSDRRWMDMADAMPKIDQSSKLAFYAALVNGEKFIASGSISESLCEELVAAGLVTSERLRQRGIAA